MKHIEKNTWTEAAVKAAFINFRFSRLKPSLSLLYHLK